MRRLLVLLSVVALTSVACKTTDKPTPDAGNNLPPDDGCHSQAAALAGDKCQLPLGDAGIEAYIYPAGDHEWFHISVPTVPPRGLLIVNAQYNTPETPVNLQVNVLSSSGSSLGLQTDVKPRGQPGPVTVVARINQPGDYYVLCQDDPSQEDDPTHANADARHPFSLTANVQSDPDTNEPNDTTATATAIPLANNQGSATGVLATTGDIDVYSLDVPAPSGREILYIGIDAPALTPASDIRLAYSIVLDGPDGGTPIAGGESLSPIGEQKFSTARLVPAGGRYYITVEPYRQHPDTDPYPPGDPRLTYTVTAQLWQDLDTNEPNDTPAEADANAVSLSLGNSVTLAGRISEVPDPDWFAVNVAGSGQNSRLRYSVTFNDNAANSKRFPPAGNTQQDNTIFVVKTEPDPGTCQTDCLGDPYWVSQGCGQSTPQCIYSYRLVDPNDGTLSNFQGEVPIPAGASGNYYVLFEDQSNDLADDREYQITLSWLPEASDEVSAYHDSAASVQGTIAPAIGGYNEDPGTGTNAASGFISYGHGIPVEEQATNDATPIPIYSQVTQDQFQHDIYTEIDYDAMNDGDLFKITLPAQTASADGGVPPLAWSTGWTVNPASSQGSGARAYDLLMTYFFCDQSENPTCDPLGQWEAIPLTYHSGTVASWNGNTGDGFGVNGNRIWAKSGACFCIESRFAASGVAYLNVSGVNRTTYDDASYEVDTAFAPYPQASCPGPSMSDGGSDTCRFCDQQYGNGCQTVTGLSLDSLGPGN
ncbi:MAG: hypothetical protein JST54_02810 [Deltaproteobacteria bacterium]|nr:hypothetical protein [Deltaproteobacteria bacterium]